jgi:hypothetical protein
MKSINVSTDVFAHIWSQRKDGEENEDHILRRLLSLTPPKNTPESTSGSTTGPSLGFYDKRHDVFFDEGFVIFRNYFGTEYRAVATSGRWWLENLETYVDSINQLSRSIGVQENAWKAWQYFSEAEAAYKPISTLRDSNKISRKHKALDDETIAQIFLDEEEADHDEEKAKLKEGSWSHDLYETLEDLGGWASLHDIYRHTIERRRAYGRSVPREYEATIRRTLENHSSDSKNYLGGADVFYMLEGAGKGVWALRKYVRSAPDT